MDTNQRIQQVGINSQEKAALIWNVANSLFGAYKPHEYGLVILPMVVIKRFHDCLLPAHDKVFAMFQSIKGLAVKDAWAEEADTAEEAPAPMPETTDCASLPNLLEISEPVPGATVIGLKNLVFMLHGKQKLLNKVTGGETIRIPDLLVNRLREYTPETLEEFTQLLDDCGAMNELQGFDYRDGKVTISFPHDENQPVIWTTYGTLVDKVVKAAMSATRVSPEENGAESEKYKMRSWLLRLGYGGADFKAQRQLLTRNLTGSSAFPDAEKAKKHTEKYLALRKAAREAKEDENERAH